VGALHRNRLEEIIEVKQQWMSGAKISLFTLTRLSYSGKGFWWGDWLYTSYRGKSPSLQKLFGFLRIRGSVVGDNTDLVTLGT